MGGIGRYGAANGCRGPSRMAMVPVDKQCISYAAGERYGGRVNVRSLHRHHALEGHHGKATNAGVPSVLQSQYRCRLFDSMDLV